MKDVRLNLTSNEGVSRAVTGLDSNATHFAMNDDQSINSLINERNKGKYNQQVDEFNENFKSHEKALEEAASKLAESIKDVSIKPIGNYLIVEPFGTNPFQKMVEKNGIVLDTGGAAPIFKSNDTGKYEEEERYIFQGSVIEIGPECKYVKPGDIIMWTKPSEIPLPFYKFGWVLVNESRALCVINDRTNLENRW